MLAEVFALLGCDPACIASWLPTFRESITYQSHLQKIKQWRMKERLKSRKFWLNCQICGSHFGVCKTCCRLEGHPVSGGNVSPVAEEPRPAAFIRLSWSGNLRFALSRLLSYNGDASCIFVQIVGTFIPFCTASHARRRYAKYHLIFTDNVPHNLKNHT